MPVLVSAPIAKAAATATVFSLPAPVDKVSIAVVFYTTSAAVSGDEVAIGTGTRDIAVSRIEYGGADAGTLTMPITGASVSAQPARTFKTLDLGAPTAMISVACPVATDPTCTHYRIWVAS